MPGAVDSSAVPGPRAQQHDARLRARLHLGGEAHELNRVAQTLLGDQQDRAAGQRFSLPRRLRTRRSRVAGHLPAPFILGPAPGIVSQQQPQQRPVAVHARRVRVERQCALVTGHRLVDAPLKLQQRAEIVVGVALVGLQRDRPPIGTLALVEPVQGHQRAGQVVVGFETGRIELDRAAKAGQRFVEPPLLLDERRQAVVGVGRVGRQLEHAPQAGDRPASIAALAIDEVQVVVKDRLLGADGDRLQQALFGRVELARSKGHHAQPAQRVGLVGHGRQHALVDVRRGGQVAGLQGLLRQFQGFEQSGHAARSPFNEPTMPAARRPCDRTLRPSRRSASVETAASSDTTDCPGGQRATASSAKAAAPATPPRPAPARCAIDVSHVTTRSRLIITAAVSTNAEPDSSSSGARSTMPNRSASGASCSLPAPFCRLTRLAPASANAAKHSSGIER